jgi:ABC-type transporter Mla subunit MlaD
VRKVALLLIIILSSAALCLWIFLPRISAHHLMLRTYYQHAQNLRKGMPVCVDGVELGSVASVTVRPELGNRPVEVLLDLRAPYRLDIPIGSTAQVAEPGILRPTVVDIDTRNAHGSPIANGGIVDGRESTDDQAAHALGVVVKAIVDQSKEPQRNQEKQSKPSSK